MDDQTSHNLSDPELAETFPRSLVRLRGCVENDDTAGSLAAAKTLQNLFNRLLQAADPAAPHQVRSSLTEIHRLLRVLNRDLLFWQGAKQTRASRSTKVLATLVSIEGFYCALTMSQAGGQSN